jgi:hypothetical protein
MTGVNSPVVMCLFNCFDHVFQRLLWSRCGSSRACAPQALSAVQGIVQTLGIAYRNVSWINSGKMLSSKQQSFAPPGKECKLECKLLTHRAPLSELMLPSTSEDLSGHLTLRATGRTRKSVTWLKKASCFFGMRPEE